MKFLLSLLFVVVNLFATTPLFKLSSALTDKAGIFTTEQKTELEQKLRSITDKQVALVTIPKLDDYTLEDYSVQLATLNKLGEQGKDNGLLILLVMKSKEVRLEVGYGLEGEITDVKAKRLINKYIIPNFKNKEYFKGVFLLISALSNTDTTAHFEESLEEKDIFSLVMTPFLIIPLFVGLFFTYRSVRAYLNYKLPKEKHAFTIISLFVSFILVYFLMLNTYEILESQQENIFGVFVMSAFMLPTFFNFILPILMLLLMGELSKIKYVRALSKLTSREAKIQKVLKEFSHSKGHLEKYKNNAVLMQHYEKLHEFGTSAPKEKYLTCKENGAIYLANISRKEKVAFEYIELCYKEAQEPQISFIKTNKETLLEKISLEGIDKLNEYLAYTNGYWSVISSMSFKSKQSSFSLSSSSSSGGYSGGGGSFGGGGASGKW